MDFHVSTSSTATATSIRQPRLVIVEEHAAVADLLDATLWGQYRVRSMIASRQTSVAALVAATRAARPDVVLIASRPGPFVDGEAVIARLAEAGVPVIALSSVEADADPVHWGRLLLAGAVGVLPKSADLAHLHAMLDLVLAGGEALCPALAARLRDAAVQAATDDECWAARERLCALSHREREVIGKLATGRCPIDIAREDVVAEGTVRSQIKSILAKLEVNSQLGAVAVVRRAGWSAAQLPVAS
jgi:DNA-binding NarL/FixJ family response regulator